MDELRVRWLPSDEELAAVFMAAYMPPQATVAMDPNPDPGVEKPPDPLRDAEDRVQEWMDSRDEYQLAVTYQRLRALGWNEQRAADVTWKARRGAK